MIKKYDYYIGIDPGVETGVACWGGSYYGFMKVESLMIHQAMKYILGFGLQTESPMHSPATRIMVVFEDARQRKWFGKKDPAAIQGAGSIKRDSKIWEDFLTDYKIPFRMVPPRAGMTKLTQESFAQLTGWKERTNNHARDAAMLVFGS